MNALNTKLLSVAVSPPALNTGGTPKPPNKSKKKRCRLADLHRQKKLSSAYVGGFTVSPKRKKKGGSATMNTMLLLYSSYKALRLRYIKACLL